MLVQDRVASDRLVLLGAQDEADRRSVTRRTTVRVVEPDVRVHLTDVLVRELAELEVDQQETLEDDVVEDEVDEELLVGEGQPLLAGDEREPLAQLQNKLRQLAEDRSLDVALVQRLTVGQVEEVEHDRRLDQIGRPFDHLTAPREVQHARLVAALA